ncbi:MAG: WcaF family extracellular polysaccharide biosynthesis acetyltransferase [Phycisphaeraceae bacterium]
MQDANDKYQARRISTWTKQEQVKRLLWSFVQATLFRYSLHNMYRWRRFLLRLFGAKLGEHTAVRPTAQIYVPWQLEMGDWSSIGDHAIIYSLGKITIGQRATISQYAHLCAGTHDYTTPDLPLLRVAITIGDECWIATDAYVGPGVTIGRMTVVGARSSVYKDLPEKKVCVGNPAKPIKDREFSSD